MRKWGKGKVRRLLGTGAGLIFKGSGFYITDYRSEGYKQAAKKEGSSGRRGSEARGKEAIRTFQTREISERVKSIEVRPMRPRKRSDPCCFVRIAAHVWSVRLAMNRGYPVRPRSFSEKTPRSRGGNAGFVGATFG